MAGVASDASPSGSTSVAGSSSDSATGASTFRGIGSGMPL
jgi:hypothetical protein